MKNVKKLPTKQLEKFSTLFTQLGLVLVLFIVYLVIEHETEQKQTASVDFDVATKVFIQQDEIPVFRREEKPKPKVETQSKVLILNEPIKKTDDNAAETKIIIKTTKEVPIDVNSLVTVDEPTDKEPSIETVPYLWIQNTPVFKGCEGLSEKDNKECFDKQMKKFVQRNFDAQLANELGLRSGKHKIFTQFIIDDKGNVVDIKINAPHIKLKNETEDLLLKLPKFTPGKQQNKTVKVRYTLPITFLVD